MTPRRGDYGFDAPYVPAAMLLGALPLAFGAVKAALRGDLAGALVFALSAAPLCLGAASFVYATRRGKFVAWSRLLDALSLRGDERVLDVGCGRGAVILLAAQRLSTGRATGIDLWQTQDQSGNGLAAAQRNAAAEGMAARVEFRTGDMRALPFDDGAYDVAVSSYAIHNVPDAAGRARAVREIARVVRPDGRVVIADFRHGADYAATLREAGFVDVRVRRLGAGTWYGGPWAATTVVEGRKGGARALERDDRPRA